MLFLYFKEEPIITPSVTFRISSTLSKFTPVLAKTGTLGIFFETSFISSNFADWPVICPETKTASGIDENTVKTLKKLLHSHTKKDGSILLSSHIDPKIKHSRKIILKKKIVNLNFKNIDRWEVL